ncbi:MAG: murein biosynthesis integral membrane protein MurJ [Patescibacteria group bacterium]
MLRRILNTESKSVAGAALLIGIATLMSRLVGIARDRTFAHFFGASAVMDAYYAAFKIPDLIYNLLIAGALTAGFIPVFTKLFFESDDKSMAWRLANNIISIVGVALLGLAFVGMIFTPILVKIIAPGFSADQLDLVSIFTRIMFLSPLLLGISMVLGGILQSLRQFLLYSIAPIFYNLGIIFGVTVLRPWIGLSALAWGVVLGAFLHLIIQVAGAYFSGYRWRWHFDLRDPETRLIGKLMLPRTIGLAMSQFNVVIVTVLASFLPIGSITVFNYANNIKDVPTGIIGISFAIAVFPLLSRLTAKSTLAEFGAAVSSTARQILFLIIPVSVCFLLLRAQIVRVILGTGEFNWDATIATADTLAFFSLGLFAQSLIPLFARAFYSMNNTKTPFVVGVISELLVIIGSLLLMGPLGVAGLALANTFGATFNMIILAILLRKESSAVIDEKLLPMLFKIVTAGIVMGSVIQILKYPLARIFDQRYLWGIFSQGAVAGLLGLLVYGIICRLLKVDEMLLLQDSLRRRWLKLWNVGEGIDQAEKL